MNKNVIGIKQKILPILKHHEVKKAALFGSSIKGAMRNDSDVDILVYIKKHQSLDFIGIKLELKEALNKKVDLVEYNSIKPLLKNRILKEQVRIL